MAEDFVRNVLPPLSKDIFKRKKITSRQEDSLEGSVYSHGSCLSCKDDGKINKVYSFPLIYGLSM